MILCLCPTDSIYKKHAPHFCGAHFIICIIERRFALIASFNNLSCYIIGLIAADDINLIVLNHLNSLLTI